MPETQLSPDQDPAAAKDPVVEGAGKLMCSGCELDPRVVVCAKPLGDVDQCWGMERVGEASAGEERPTRCPTYQQRGTGALVWKDEYN